MEDKQLIEEVHKLNQDLHDEHDISKLNDHIDRFERLLNEAKDKWRNIGRLTIIPRPRKIAPHEGEAEGHTQMGMLKSAAGQLEMMVNRKGQVA